MNELTRRRVVSAATNRRLFFLKKKRKFEIFVVSTFPLLEAGGWTSRLAVEELPLSRGGHLSSF